MIYQTRGELTNHYTTDAVCESDRDIYNELGFFLILNDLVYDNFCTNVDICSFFDQGANHVSIRFYWKTDGS